MPNRTCFIHDPTQKIILGLRYDPNKMAKVDPNQIGNQAPP